MSLCATSGGTNKHLEVEFYIRSQEVINYTPGRHFGTLLLNQLFYIGFEEVVISVAAADIIEVQALYKTYM